MHSLTTALTPRSLRILMLLAATALPCFGSAQTADTSRFADAERQYLALIDGIEEDKGSNAVELIEPLGALSRLYLEQGLYDQAASGFERVRGVVRINHGFSTVQELELVRQQVKAEEAAGHVEKAWELEQTLVMLARENSSDLATFAVFRELADKRLDILRRYRAGAFPPQIELGCYYGSSARDGPCNSGNRITVLIALLGEARSFQMAAIDALLKNDRYTDPELQQLVTGMLRTSESLHVLNRSHADGFLINAIQRVLAYETSDPVSLEQQARFLVQLADMNVYHASPGTRPAGYDAVPGQYQLAYTRLKSLGTAQAALDTLFAPAVPVMLPSYASNPLVAVEGSVSDAYIDVEFDINKYGRSEHVDIVAATDAVTRADRRALTRLLGENRFRPYMSDGQLAESTHVTVRYYLPADAPVAD